MHACRSTLEDPTANATIGRAHGLLSQNLQGGAEPGLSYFGSQGNTNSYGNACFAENEERSPWEPFHVSRGFDAGASAVTVFGSVRTTIFRYPIREETWAAGLLGALAALELAVDPIVLLDPLAAEQFTALAGLTTRSSFAEWIAEHASRRARDYWDTFEGLNLFRPRAVLGNEPWAGLLARDVDPIPLFAPGEVHVAVVGGETLGSYRVSGAVPVVTVPVDPWR